MEQAVIPQGHLAPLTRDLATHRPRQRSGEGHGVWDSRPRRLL